MCVENRLLELRERGGNEEWERKMVEMERRKEKKEGMEKKKRGGAEIEQTSSRQRQQTRKRVKESGKEFLLMRKERERKRGKVQRLEPIVLDD